MVRPTEEEKDLQNVQKVQDSGLRPEFVEQMQRLRNKVFIRIKPKQLNGKILNGQMFFELCQAYTASINKGSVPSIKSAWTNLCQNENLRAIQEAIRNYEAKMSQAFDSPQQIKDSHKKHLSDSLNSFKSKAFGETTQDCLDKIEKEILLKYS